MSDEELREKKKNYDMQKLLARRDRIRSRQDKEIGAAFFSQYKHIPEGAKDEFRRLMEEDWREHRKFDAPPEEEIIDAEVVEE